MTVLTIYTSDYDSRENVHGKGMSGKVFVENVEGEAEDGAAFKSIDQALDYCASSGTMPERIDFNYLSKDGVQKFWKFAIQ
jgi:hypothetical protein